MAAVIEVSPGIFWSIIFLAVWFTGVLIVAAVLYEDDDDPPPPPPPVDFWDDR